MVIPSGIRAYERCRFLSQDPFSDLPDTLFRPYLGRAHLLACHQVIDWMAESGMIARLDAAGNVVGRYEGQSAGAPALLIGSHLDSVRNAGAFDGPLGVMLGIECVAWFASKQQRFPFAIEVIAFGDEEGSRFPASMLCSRAFAGQLRQADLELRDANQVSLKDALIAIDSTPEKFLGIRRSPDFLVGYLEAHIEQGPELEAKGVPLGCVTGIAGQLRIECEVEGVAGHAGTVSMLLRRDALAGAAEAIQLVERIAKDHTSRSRGSGAATCVATVGKFEVQPNLPNVIPGLVRFTIDVRSLDTKVRNQLASEINSSIQKILSERGLSYCSRVVHDLGASLSDPRMTAILEAAVKATNQRAYRLPSGAGHDAIAMSTITPMTMLFLRCEGGISHHPSESILPSDAEVALKAMIEFVNRFQGRA
jgi:allantoate deiminase